MTDPRWRVDENGCWLWTGAVQRSKRTGYGLDTTGRMAHRLVYEEFIGPIPDGLQLDHLCRVRHCVNPAHLEPVTHRENQLRGFGASGVNARKTHCIAGHAFDEGNTYRQTGNRRACRKCNAEAVRRYKARKKDVA